MSLKGAYRWIARRLCTHTRLENGNALKVLITAVTLIMSLAQPGRCELPAADRSMYAIIDSSGKIVKPYKEGLYYRERDKPAPQNFRIVKNVEKDVFQTEDIADNHVIATFPANVRLYLVDDSGLIQAATFDSNKPSSHEGYVKPTGEIVVPIEFDKVGPYAANGLAFVQKGQHRGFVDANGKFKIPLDTFTDAGAFGPNGLAPARITELWGYIDAQGAFVILPQFKDARSFGPNGLAPAKQGALWGYVNESGVFIIAPAFDDAWSFDASGEATVKHVGRSKTFFSRAFGEWTLSGDVLPVPEDIHGLGGLKIEVTGHSSNNRVTWRVIATGSRLNTYVDANAPPTLMGRGFFDDFPANDSDIFDTFYEMSPPLTPDERAELLTRREDFIQAIVAMRAATEQYIGKISGPHCGPQNLCFDLVSSHTGH